MGKFLIETKKRIYTLYYIDKLYNGDKDNYICCMMPVFRKKFACTDKQMPSFLPLSAKITRMFA